MGYVRTYEDGDLEFHRWYGDGYDPLVYFDENSQHWYFGLYGDWGGCEQECLVLDPFGEEPVPDEDPETVAAWAADQLGVPEDAVLVLVDSIPDEDARAEINETIDGPDEDPPSFRPELRRVRRKPRS